MLKTSVGHNVTCRMLMKMLSIDDSTRIDYEAVLQGETAVYTFTVIANQQTVKNITQAFREYREYLEHYDTDKRTV